MGSNRKIVYLCGPVDEVSSNEASSWRKQAASVLEAHGYITFHPNKAWMGIKLPLPKEQAEAVDAICREAIIECDIILANLHKTTLGSCREIEYGRSIDKRVVVFTNGRDIVNVMSHDLEIFATLERALICICGDGVLDGV